MSATEQEQAIGQATRPGPSSDIRATIASLTAWPLTIKLFVAALLLLYIPVIREAIHAWLTYEDYAHGVFILPVSAVLVWMRREEIRRAAPNPTAWGIPILIFGLALQISGYLLSIGFLAIISLVPVLAGAVLALHGRNLWRIVRFAICFLAFASTFPGSVTARPSQWIQKSSTSGAVEVVKLAGVPVIQTGNLIEIPGLQFEVAQVCSGYKKLTALIAFAALYGHVFLIGYGKRFLLLAAAVPIALVANIIRIAGLVLIASKWGDLALNAAHDWAEVFVLVLAFAMFVAFGKLIGCKTLRHSL